MKKLNLLLIIFLLPILITNCSAPKQVVKQPVAVFKPIEKERVINKSFETIWQSTIELLATYNMPIKNLDKSSGFISTEYKQVTGNPSTYMKLVGANSTFSGKVELTNAGGNLNILVKSIKPDSTKVTVNVFYDCLKNTYKYANLISTQYVLQNSVKTECESTGKLEKAILEYLSKK